MPLQRPLFFFLFGLVALVLPACGGGGTTAAVDDPDTELVEDPPVVPGDPTLDAQLAPVLANAGVATPPSAPPQDGALVALGRALFFDKILSGNRNIACATCHHPSAGSADALSVSIGEGGVGVGAGRSLATGTLIPRNAPALFNLGLPAVRQMFWDSRVSLAPGPGNVLQTPEPALNGARPTAPEITALLDSALSAQALFPLLSEAEMRGQGGENEIADAADNLQAWRLLMIRLVGSNDGRAGGFSAYRSMFNAAYPAVASFDELNIGHAARAIGAYEADAYRALQSPFDDYMAGDTSALSDDAKRGALLFFGQGDCSRCHGGPLLTDNRHHAIAVPQVGPGRDFPFEDIGREAVTGDPDDRYQFRTPSLRNVALTGPWMHDGAYTSLAATVAHYNNPTGSLLNYNAGQLAPLLRNTVDRDPTRNQARADALSPILRPAPRLNRTDVDRIVAFLESLTDPVSTDLSAEVPASVPSGLPVGD